MARARNIKPAFFKNEYLAKLSFPARLLFIALWTLADCQGRLEDRPQRIKAEAFPYDADLDVDRLLDELATSPEKFIVRYVVDAKPYIQIANFLKHQNPHKREKEAGSQISPCPVQDRDQAGPKPGLAPDWHSTCPADSLLLNPECGNPKTETDASASRVSDPGLEKMVSDNYNYLLSTDNPNLCSSPGWTLSYLKHMIPVLQKEHPGLSDDDIGACWRDAIDSAIQKKIWTAGWIKKAFEGKVRSFVPCENKTLAHGAANTQARDALLSYPFIRHALTGECIPAEKMEARPEAPATLFYQGSSFPIAHLEGIQEPEEMAS